MYCKYCNKEIKLLSNLNQHEKSCEKIFLNKNEIVRLYIEEFISVKKLCKIYNITTDNMLKILKDVIRNQQESKKLSDNFYNRKYVCSEKTKEKIRQARFNYNKNNQEKIGWIVRDCMSYYEKKFYDKLIELEYDKKYHIIIEKPIYPYFIDFAFENEKLAVEIDGSQHLRIKNKENDLKKDALLIKNGWSVLRFTATEVNRNIDNVINLLNDKLINLNKIEIIKVGIHKYINENKYTKKEKNKYNFTKKQINNIIISRKVKDRPSLKQLELDIKELKYCGTSRKYNVSDACIRNWIKQYKNDIENKLEIVIENKELEHNDIEKYKKKIVRKKKTELTEKQKLYFYNRRKIKNRPSLEEIQINIKNIGWLNTAKLYNICKSTLFKWIKQYKNLNNNYLQKY
jgi:very-short-patch-repair endonuclease